MPVAWLRPLPRTQLEKIKLPFTKATILYHKSLVWRKGASGKVGKVGPLCHRHAVGRRMTFPCVPTGISSGSWHFAGRSRGMFL